MNANVKKRTNLISVHIFSLLSPPPKLSPTYVNGPKARQPQNLTPKATQSTSSSPIQEDTDF